MNQAVFDFLPAGGLDALRLALDAAGLPTDDVGEPGRRFFCLADEAGLIGFIGLEGAGPDRLLRSLVVLPMRRGSGLGRQLLAHLEAYAEADGAMRLHLLTTSAARFFHGQGYGSAVRADAPPAIAATAQFASLCPDSAAYLVKELA